LDILDDFTPFKIIFITFTRLVPKFVAIIGVMVSLMYFYSSIGVQVFGGLIRFDNAALAASDYGLALYYPNNFNDFASSTVVLFELLIGNNWNVIQDGFLIVFGSLVRFFFITYYLSAVVITLNLVVALILDAFIDEMKKAEEEGKAEEEEEDDDEKIPKDGADGKKKEKPEESKSDVQKSGDQQVLVEPSSKEKDK